MIERENSDIREPAVAGAFYPLDAEELKRTLAGLVAGTSAAPDNRIRAIIVPHAGYMYSGGIAAEGFAALASQKGQLARLVVIGPAHFVAFKGIAAPTVRAFRTPLGDVPLDAAAINRIAALSQVVIDDAPHASEHALEVELPFLQALFGVVPIVPLVVGLATAEEVAQVLERLWDENTAIVVSSDLSHYHDYETASRLDQSTALAIERSDEAAIGTDDACGSIAIRGLLIEANRRGLSIERLALANSGDTGGGRDSVVGYGAWAVRRH